MNTCTHRHTFEKAPIDGFLDSLLTRNYSGKSISSYRDALNGLTDYLTQQDVSRVQDVTVNHLESYRLTLINRELSNATQYHYIRCARFLFSYLEATHQIFINPAAALDVPKFKRPLQQVPSVDEVLRLLEQPDTETPTGLRDKAFLETMYSCGLRRDEAISTLLHDINFKDNTIRVHGKGRKERMLPLGKTAKYWIELYITEARPMLIKTPDTSLLWVSLRGNKLSHSTVDKLIQKYSITAGLQQRMSAHALRRACATHMLSNGAHPVELQLFLGHSDVKNLSQYLKVTITEMKAMHERSRVGQ